MSSGLLLEAVAVAPETEQRLGERVVAAVDEAQAHLQAAIQAFELADRLSGEQTWCSQLLANGSVTAWAGSRVRISPKAAGHA